MKYKYRLFIYFIFLNTLFVRAQGSDPRFYNYSRADNLMLFFHGYDFPSIGRVARFINNNFHTDHEKLRAAFIWVADNIEYSYSYSKANLNEVFKAKKAVCRGYSELFKAICDSCNIKCRVVTGIAKNDFDFVDTNSVKFKHAWNIVNLYGKEYNIDVTWSAGSLTKNKVFIKAIRYEYFLTDPEVFILQHYPDSSYDQLINFHISKLFFASSPSFLLGAVENKLISCSPEYFHIKAKYKSEFLFTFITKQNISDIGVKIYHSLKGQPKLLPIQLDRNQNNYSFCWLFTDRGEYYVSICLNETDAIFYKVSVQ